MIAVMNEKSAEVVVLSIIERKDQTCLIKQEPLGYGKTVRPVVFGILMTEKPPVNASELGIAEVRRKAS